MSAPRHAAPVRPAARIARPIRPPAPAPVATTPGPATAQAFSYASVPTHPPAAPSGANTGSAEAPPIVHDVLRGAGAPLDDGTRTAMEQRLGHDLSGVRIHTDERLSLIHI